MRVRDRDLLRGGALVAGLAGLGLWLPSYELLSLNQHLLLALNVLALNFCLGLGGQVSLAQGAFCGAGAYLSVLLHARAPWATPLILPLVALAGFGLGWAVSRPLEKLGEGFLAMATLGVSLIFTNLVVSLDAVTGGPDGMMVDASLSLFGALSLSGDVAHFLVLLGLLALGLYVFAAVGASRPGRALLACREDAVAAQACGIDRPGVRSAAFGISAGLSALAGAVYAHYSGFISPAQFDLELSLKALLYLVIGGPGRMVAPLAAVLILETILAHVHFLGEAKVLFHGLLLGAALLVDQGWWRGALVGAKKLGRIPGQGIM